MKREFVINRNGKDYVLYAGLLDLAHQQGLKAIKTQLIQVPSGDNGQVAICFAEVTTEKGTFTGIGDAGPGNVRRMMATGLSRMAELQAVLADYLTQAQRWDAAPAEIRWLDHPDAEDIR